MTIVRRRAPIMTGSRMRRLAYANRHSARLGGSQSEHNNHPLNPTLADGGLMPFNNAGALDTITAAKIKKGWWYGGGKGLAHLELKKSMGEMEDSLGDTMAKLNIPDPHPAQREYLLQLQQKQVQDIQQGLSREDFFFPKKNKHYGPKRGLMDYLQVFSNSMYPNAPANPYNGFPPYSPVPNYGAYQPNGVAPYSSIPSQPYNPEFQHQYEARNYASMRNTTPLENMAVLTLEKLGSYDIPLHVKNGINILINKYEEAGTNLLKRLDIEHKMAKYLQANIHDFIPAENYNKGRMLFGNTQEVQAIMADLLIYSPNNGVKLTESKFAALGIRRNRDEMKDVLENLTAPAVDRYKTAFLELNNLLPAHERGQHRSIREICSVIRNYNEKIARTNKDGEEQVNLNTMEDILIKNLGGGEFPLGDAPTRGVFDTEFQILEQVVENHTHGVSVGKYLDLLKNTLDTNATRKHYRIKAKINDENAYIFNRGKITPDGTINNTSVRDHLSYPSYLCDLLGQKFKEDNYRNYTLSGFNVKGNDAVGFLTIAEGSNIRTYDFAKITEWIKKHDNPQTRGLFDYINGMHSAIIDDTKKQADNGDPTVRVKGGSKIHFRTSAFLKAENQFAFARVANTDNPSRAYENSRTEGLEGQV